MTGEQKAVGRTGRETDTAVRFRWLGVGGIELAVGDQVLAIDPLFTRLPFWRMWVGRAHADSRLGAVHLPHCDWVLVTHTHWDHVMDVPAIARRTRAIVLGSAHTCTLAAACGVPAAQIREIGPGAQLALGPFQVHVRLGAHQSLPGFGPGPLRHPLKPPLRPRDYRLDICLSFAITVHGQRLLVWHSIYPEPALPADVLFVGATEPDSFYTTLIDAVGPRLVIPVHWDDFFRPLSRPQRTTLLSPRLAWPPLPRLDMAAWQEMIEQLTPGANVLVPELLHSYNLSQLTAGSG